jgi:hypothetical protein
MKKRMITALILGIVIPWILSYLFLYFLTDLNWVDVANTGGIPQILAILSFSSVGFNYNVPVFGYGYTIPLLIWILTGIFCGLLAKGAVKGALITLLGLFLNIMLFVILNMVNPAFIPGSLQTPETLGLLSGFSLDFVITLGIFLFWYSLTIPGGAIGGIIGGMISRTGIKT